MIKLICGVRQGWSLQDWAEMVWAALLGAGAGLMALRWMGAV